MNNLIQRFSLNTLQRGLPFAAAVLFMVTAVLAGLSSARAQTEIIVDNGTANFATIGTWPASTSVSGYFGSNYQSHEASGLPPGAIVVDNGTAGFSVTGDWPNSTAVGGYLGSNYQVHEANGLPPTAVVVDNIAGSFTGTWTTSTAVSGFYSTNYHVIPAGTGANAFTWTGSIANAGTYQVYARWTSHPNRASDAKYTIAHAGGNATVTANQEQNSGAWQLLGTYTFNAGNATVSLSDEANGYVIADAVMFVPPNAAPPTATWSFNLGASGSYEVYARWTQHPNRATDAKYTVNHASGATTVEVNQELNGGTWQLLGTYTMNAGTATVSLTDVANGYVVADAVRLQPVGTPPNSAVWTPPVTAAGSYQLYARWTQNANRASNAKYVVVHAGGASTVTVNQQAGGGTWNLLGTYTFTPGAGHKVTLTDDANGFVIADAIRLVAANQNPTVSITSPANNAVVNAPGNITITTNAADPDGTVSKVDFYQGATLIGTATTAPFNFTWTNVAAGTYSLTAVATDNSNASTTSAAVNVIVNALPTVSITAPANNTVVQAGGSATLTAAAADADGTVTKVDFYQGATLVGTATAAPFTATVSNLAAGTYSFTAVATDNRNATATSGAITVVVNAAPTVSITAPANGAVFQNPANVTLTATAADTDGTIAKVDFFQGATLVGTATTAPYTVTVNGFGAGSYSFTAVATDNANATTTSAAVSIRVNAAPTVSLTSPANGATANAPATISLAATAADADGSIAKVEFFQGATLVATVTSAPYTFTLSNVAPGTYSFTAVATDNDGATATSAAASVTVNAAPTVSITSPANNAVFQAPATVTITATAADADGSVTKVDFYQGATLVGTATSAPYSVTLPGLSAGTYSFTAVATDNSGATTTSAAISVKVNAAPAVTLTSPTTGASFTAPATINLAATASDGDGTIAQVEFYTGTTLIATVTSAPYTYAWTNVPQGNYVITAKAIDNDGGTATSAAATITVNAAVGQLYFIHPDHLNTPRLIADSTQTTVWKWDQAEPFGNNVPNEDPDGNSQNFEFNLRFPGQYFDKETNLAYNYFREYDPAVGRYIQSDPIGLRGGGNTFSYVFSSPVATYDYLGLRSCSLRSRWLGEPFDLVETSSTFIDVGSFPRYNSAATAQCALEVKGDKKSPIPPTWEKLGSCIWAGVEFDKSPNKLILETLIQTATTYRAWVTEEWCVDGCGGKEYFSGVVGSGTTRLGGPREIDRTIFPRPRVVPKGITTFESPF